MAGVVMVEPAGPLTKVQVPVPTVAALPASVTLAASQTLISFPALAVVPTCVTVILTLSDVGGQVPLEIVHANV